MNYFLLYTLTLYSLTMSYGFCMLIDALGQAHPLLLLSFRILFPFFLSTVILSLSYFSHFLECSFTFILLISYINNWPTLHRKRFLPCIHSCLYVNLLGVIDENWCIIRQLSVDIYSWDSRHVADLMFLQAFNWTVSTGLLSMTFREKKISKIHKLWWTLKDNISSFFLWFWSMFRLFILDRAIFYTSRFSFLPSLL